MAPTEKVSKIKNSLLSTRLFILLLMMGFCMSSYSVSYAQLVPDTFGNNATDIRWQQMETDHFNIVFAHTESAIIPYLASEAEATFEEYKRRLGVAPERKISLFYNGPGELVSGVRAKDTDDEFSIWRGDIFTKSPTAGLQGINEMLRLEIAHAFRQHLNTFPIDYWVYLFARPSRSPWSDGITSYLAQPSQTPRDVSLMRNFLYDRSYNITEPSLQPRLDTITGRSQIQFFDQFFSNDSLPELYAHRSRLLGIVSYYDFNAAFKSSVGLSYESFQMQWEAHQFSEYRKQQPGPNSGGARILPPRNVLEYHGVAVNRSKEMIAAISTPDNGNILPELRVKSLIAGTPETQVDQGFFDSEMDWSPNGDLLAYAKRIYKNSREQYAYQLYIWDQKTGNTNRIVKERNAFLPAFSPEGSALVFAERTSAATVLWRYDMRTTKLHKIHSFPQQASVTHLDYHPQRNLILVSFKQNGVYKAELLSAESADSNILLTQREVNLNARWSPGGDFIYFNRKAESVPNIFRAEFTGNQLKNVRQVTSSFYGAELMEFMPNDSDALKLLAKTDRDKINVFSGVGQSSETTVSAAKMVENDSTTGTGKNQQYAENYSVEPYHAFADVSLEKPFFAPYYLNTDEFGLALYLSAIDPMREHEFNYRGSVSFSDPFQSFFFSSYTNNSFRPRLKLRYNHFPTALGILSEYRKVHTADIIGLSSLWKLTGISQDYSDWYFGLRLRHLAFDYYPEQTFRRHHPDLFLNNRQTRQTDLKAALVWRNLEPSRHTLIHPLDGTGVRFAATGSGEVLGSQTQHLRLNLDAYHIFPAYSAHRLYAYLNGITGVGQVSRARLYNA